MLLDKGGWQGQERIPKILRPAVKEPCEVPWFFNYSAKVRRPHRLGLLSIAVVPVQAS